MEVCSLGETGGNGGAAAAAEVAAATVAAPDCDVRMRWDQRRDRGGDAQGNQHRPAARTYHGPDGCDKSLLSEVCQRPVGPAPLRAWTPSTARTGPKPVRRPPVLNTQTKPECSSVGDMLGVCILSGQ